MSSQTRTRAKRMPRHSALSLALLLALSSVSHAQVVAAEQPVSQESTPDPDAILALAEVVVQGKIDYRDRTDDTAPVLSYDLAYFQRFEPLTVGDMLKRVPSVAFVSDVLEYDGAQLRGLQAAYTQILVNGKKVPGAGDDRSFFVDRIPAELVERIEIVRSNSANRSGDALAGAINIVLRDAYVFDGVYVRAGALYFTDGEFKESYGAVASGDVGGGRLLAGFNVQGRYNPKLKQSLRFEQPGGEFANREDQTDTRDGTDYSANLAYSRLIGEGELRLNGFFVHTDRRETEQSFEYNTLQGASRNNLLSINDQVVGIDQDNYALGATYEFSALGGNNELALQEARFKEDRFDTEVESGFDDEDSTPAFDGREGTRELLDSTDRERTLRLAHTREWGNNEFELGVDFSAKRRESLRAVSEIESDEEAQPLPAFAQFERERSRIEEDRADPFVMLSGNPGALKWEAGVRYETTDSGVRTLDADNENASSNSDYGILLPSLHLRWDLSEAQRLSASFARSVRRPDFNLLLPFTLEGEFGDNDFVGNPNLAQEDAWGLDLGFEQRLGRDGVFGVNFFYRDIRNLIEVINTGAPSATAQEDFEEEIEEFLEENPNANPNSPGYPSFDPDSFLYSAANVGDGEVYGVEFDLSTPLGMIGLPDTGLFANYAWLDSQVDDDIGERRFNNQARFVYNLGFIHDFSDAGFSFGLSYRKQGTANFRVLAEEVETRYGADLEAFIEKRFGKSFSVRLTGSNLLDAQKQEDFNKFDTLGDQLDRDFDEFEREVEESERVIQLIARYAF